MNKTIALQVLFVVLLLLASIARCHAEVGTVTRLLGSADITRGDTPALPLQVGDTIQQHDILRTKSASSLEITMSDGSRLSLGESTRVEVTEFVTGAQPVSLLEVTRGRLRAFVTALFSSRQELFRVRTPTAVVGVQGTDFTVLAQALLTQVIVYDGVIVASNVDPRIRQREILRAGQSTLIKRGEPPQPAASLAPVVFGSGGTLYLRTGGEQVKEPTLLVPTVPSSVPTPPMPRPPPP